MTTSLYWDDFQRRAIETAQAIKRGQEPLVRRVAVFVTERCNFRCQYCNVKFQPYSLSEDRFEEILEDYGDTALIHITGGEPSMVPWLYPLIRELGDEYRFNLNTNAYITPPYNHVGRLKISLDDYDAERWNKLVGREGAFDRVVENIKESCLHTTVSLTCVVTAESYKRLPQVARFASGIKGLYALFFSTYKGNDPRFVLTDEIVDELFDKIIPEVKKELGPESLALLEETLTDKYRLKQGVRFPENDLTKTCYLSMSERVISPTGREYRCSHLYRDKIYRSVPEKHFMCQYGCNTRLAKFNLEVEQMLEDKNI